MTEDTSPENLRKFLESDDPALVRMGLSMAKGSGVPEELHLTLLGILLWDSEEGNREAAKDLVDGIGIKNIPEFRGWLESLDNLDVDIHLAAVAALEKIGNKRAVGPLIKALDDDNWVRESAAEALGQIGDKRAVEPLIKLLNDDDLSMVTAAAYALGWIGDKRAVRHLGDAIEYACYDLGDEDIAIVAAEAIANIGDDSGVNQLIGALEMADGDALEFAIIEALKKLGLTLEE